MNLLKWIAPQRGSIYIELLIAFLCWMVIISTLIPAFMKITVERKELEIEKEAHKLLSNQYMNTIIKEPGEVVWQGKFTEYRIDKRENGNGTLTICVNTTKIGVEKNVCRTIIPQF